MLSDASFQYHFAGNVMARPKKQLSLAEFGLNQNLIGQIEDLQEAFLGAPQME